MTTKHEFHILAALTPPPRNERINVGLLMWGEEGPYIYSAASTKRLAALDPNLPRLPIVAALIEGRLQQELREALSRFGTDTLAWKSALPLLIDPLHVDPQPGSLYATSDDELAAVIERLLDAMVRRPGLELRAPPKTKRANSPLDRELAAWFRSAHIMGRRMDDLSRHRIVPQYPIAADADVYADFAFRNGALHVIETLDLRGADHVTGTIRHRTAFKSLTLDMARDVVGQQGRRLGVLAADDFGAMKPAIRLFERNADDLFVMESDRDRQRLADFLAEALHVQGGLSLPA